MSLLSIENLSVLFDTQRGLLRAVDRVSLEMKESETLGLVGESGSGKSVTSLALMGLLPPQARVEKTKALFRGEELFSGSEKKRRKIRGKEMAMVFQDPMTSLNPCFSVEFQLGEVLKIHKGIRNRTERRKQAIRLMERVGIADPETRLHCYPHELSGGMAQRVMIAIAIAAEPRLLIADEPTTALDVTIQAQILDLLRDLQQNLGMGLILITHDLGIVAEMAKSLAVMYAGQIVEAGNTRDILHKPAHPYTESLLQCLPHRHAKSSSKGKLPTIPGMVPDLVNRPTGCQLNPRCSYTDGQCRSTEPNLQQIGERLVKCFRPLVRVGVG